MSRGERPTRRGLRRGDDGGFVLVWSALLMVVLLVFCGMGVDVSNWWFQSQRQQRTADASALAGVVFMPDGFTQAQTIATSTAVSNGFSSGVTVSRTGVPSQLKVQVTQTVRNFFGSVIGMNTTQVTRQAVAEYQGSVPMGSPDPYLGQDPDRGHYEHLWLNIAGPAATKVSGDRYTAKACGTGVYGCTASGNSEYLKDNGGTTNEGYFYAISVTTPGTVTVQVYDPAFIYTGDTCGTNMPSAAQAATYTNTAIYGDNPTQRYAPGEYCTGDQDISGSNMNTAYIVRAPDSTPWNDLDNPVVTGCVQNFRPINTSLPTLLASTNTSADAVYTRANFHRWVTVCTITNATVGDYELQVRTNHNPANPLVYDSSVATGGHNRFSIRVDGGSVSVFGNGKLPIYVNAGASTTPTFYLARITPGSAEGRNLKLQFYDIGDVGSGAVDMQVVPPGDANVGSNFSGCTYRVNGTAQPASSTCTLTGMAGGSYQGGLVDVSVPIPNNWSCNYTVPSGCWIKIKMSFTGGATPTDTTTWTASVDGDPVRLVE